MVLSEMMDDETLYSRWFKGIVSLDLSGLKDVCLDIKKLVYGPVRYDG